MTAARIKEDLKAAGRLKGRRFYEPKEMIWHTNGFCFGNPDRLLVDKDTGHLVEGYECKWVTSFGASAWPPDGESQRLPPHVIAQAFHYLWVMRNSAEHLGPPLERWWVVATIGGGETRYYEIQWSDKAAKIHEEKMKRFWFDHVVPGIPPAHTHRASDSKSLNRRFSNEVEEVLEACDEVEERLERLKEIRATTAKLKEEESLIRNDLRVIMGSSTKLIGKAANVSFKRPKSTKKIDYKGLVNTLTVDEKTVAKFTTKTEPDRRLVITIKGDEQ